MKKTIIALALIIGLFAFGTQASAALVVNINGGIDGNEWDANPATQAFYLRVIDPNESNANPNYDIPDAYDISRVTVLQELDAFGGDSDPTNDGVYLLIETYAAPSLADYVCTGCTPPESSPGGDLPRITFDADWGDATAAFPMLNTASPTTDGTDIKMIHAPALADGSGQTVQITMNVFGVTGDIVPSGGQFAMGSVIEYFIPSGPFGTPPLPFGFFPFKGTITYDNGSQPPDDIAVGVATVIPEPGSMFLFGSALLGLFGIRFKK